MISRHQTRTLSFLFLLLLFVALSRLILLDARPFHHDESLFSYYAWVLCDSGDYSHHPLLHGPLQIQLVAASLKTSTWLGIHGNGDFWARFPAAMAGIILLLLVWLLRRPLGKEGRWIAALLAAVSPGIWYYSRFCRNEPLFLCVTVLFLWTITRAWRSTRPSGWIVASFLAGAGLIALKENSLFLLFDGICFLGLMVLYGCKHGTGRIGKPLVSSLRVHRWAWLAALLAGWLLLEAIYTNFLQWDKAFLAKYAEILGYWWGQHREHRLYGEFHYYLPILFLYQPFTMAVLLWSAGRFFLRRPIPGSLLLLFAMAGLWFGRFGDTILAYLGIPENLLPALHMTSPWHLGLVGAVGWMTLYGAWGCLNAGRPFRAWLIWWTGLSFLQYSYAGEKVPWVSLHITLPAILLAANLLGEWWRREKTLSHGLRLKGMAALLAVALLLNLAQGFRLCFVHPTNPGEILIYNHTQPVIREIGHAIRQRATTSPDGLIPLTQGQANWPMLWYLHGIPLLFVEELHKADFLRVSSIVCDSDYVKEFPDLSVQFDLKRVPLRMAWVPERLHLLTRAQSAQDPDKSLCGWNAWATLGRYLILRQPWGDPGITAQPVEVRYGTRRDGN